MPRVKSDVKSLFTFVKGLVTEATGISYPENSMVDGNNIDVNIDGSAKRRKGLDFEQAFNFYINTFTAEEIQNLAISFHPWKAVNNNGNINFFVVQVGTKLYVGDLDGAVLSNSFFGEIDLSDLTHTYSKPHFTTQITTNYVVNQDAQYYLLDSSYGKGRIFFNNRYINPFYLEYDEELGRISPRMLVLFERDFDGVVDTFAVDEQPLGGTNTPDHLYNLQNQGWNDPLSVTGSGAGSSSDGSASGNPIYIEK